MASYLADTKKPSTKTLQRLLRHKELRTTEIYLHLVDEAVRDAMSSVEGIFVDKEPEPYQLVDSADQKVEY